MFIPGVARAPPQKKESKPIFRPFAPVPNLPAAETVTQHSPQHPPHQSPPLQPAPQPSVVQEHVEPEPEPEPERVVEEKKEEEHPQAQDTHVPHEEPQQNEIPAEPQREEEQTAPAAEEEVQAQHVEPHVEQQTPPQTSPAQKPQIQQPPAPQPTSQPPAQQPPVVETKVQPPKARPFVPAAPKAPVAPTKKGISTENLFDNGEAFFDNLASQAKPVTPVNLAATTVQAPAPVVNKPTFTAPNRPPAAVPRGNPLAAPTINRPKPGGAASLFDENPGDPFGGAIPQFTNPTLKGPTPTHQVNKPQKSTVPGSLFD
eukprot:TRINITY_DN9836_c0_g1_i1.p1 TRINITY_DN9836_c0_g1~~TRINITY_DN9836_c0_g1_i1.p1  ORF type:complete len:315 (-),score=90.17 TRINITY_DN9836_c0_g1_i1:133-1077(-)